MKLLKNAAFASLLVVPLLAPALSRADEETFDAPGQGLPLRQVSLFSSGVGYFGRAGKVSGNGDVELYFQRNDLNDVLKSLVITDPSGELRPATYSLDELLARRPQNNDLALPSGATLGEILRGFQGASIEIEAGGRKIVGRLIGVATRNIRDKNGDVIAVDIATVMQKNGLASVRLDTVENGGTVRLLDAKLNRKLGAQLESSATRLVSSVDAGFRPIRLHFAGKGERQVKAGYIQATSVWKTSYRLVFDSAKKAATTTKTPVRKNKANEVNDIKNDTRPLLQGWAIVENTTDEDWKDVGLSLIAGRPVSFSMNMAAPLYVQRPEVALPFAGAPRSQVYEEATETKLAARPRAVRRAPANAPSASAAAADASLFSNSGEFAREEDESRKDVAISAEQLALQQAAATSGERGELFEYSIRQPVSLNRGEAAMVPIVSQAVSGEKLTILDARQSNLSAVYGMRIHNTTGLHLAGGPITIYQDGLYAGDAQVTNIAPGDHRLISYALDSDLVVGRETPTYRGDITSLAISNGVLTITRKQRQIQTFTLRNKALEAKTVLLQIPIDTNYTLVEPKAPSEKSPTEYRFEVVVPANATTPFKFAGERVIYETVIVLNADIDTLAAYAKNTQVSPALKTALNGVVIRRNKLRELQNRRAYVEKQIEEISAEQTRIRLNMNSLARSSDLYKRYVAKLSAQESQIESLRREVARLRALESDANSELSTFIQNLNFSS
ncbi:MAG TPA: hypothetical protein VM821_01665 [Abditibacteriaceae bacterium]|nr:hypothetical protein [Abditibacteriaceae bacterium]